jgi:hypothetical protein
MGWKTHDRNYTAGLEARRVKQKKKANDRMKKKTVE